MITRTLINGQLTVNDATIFQKTGMPLVPPRFFRVCVCICCFIEYLCSLVFSFARLCCLQVLYEPLGFVAVPLPDALHPVGIEAMDFMVTD